MYLRGTTKIRNQGPGLGGGPGRDFRLCAAKLPNLAGDASQNGIAAEDLAIYRDYTRIIGPPPPQFSSIDGDL